MEKRSEKRRMRRSPLSVGTHCLCCWGVSDLRCVWVQARQHSPPLQLTMITWYPWGLCPNLSNLCYFLYYGKFQIHTKKDNIIMNSHISKTSFNHFPIMANLVLSVSPPFPLFEANSRHYFICNSSVFILERKGLFKKSKYHYHTWIKS